VRLVEIELDKLKLDPHNPRLHSVYLTHALPPKPSEKQLMDALAGLPEFQSLLDAITRNVGCFQPPLITADCRVLEGNRRITALKLLRAGEPGNRQWEAVTVHQLTSRIPVEQERALRAKFHLEHALAWDGLSQLIEYTGLAERGGVDALAAALGKPCAYVEPLIVAGRAVRLFSQAHPEAHAPALLEILAGLCGVQSVAPKVAISKAGRCVFTASDEERPREQPFALAQVMRWLAEGRFTAPYEHGGRAFAVKPSKVPTLFRDVRRAGEQAMSYFLEEGGSLAKAVCFLEHGYSDFHREQRRLVKQSQQFLDTLGALRTIRRDEQPDLYRESVAIYNRLAVLLSPRLKEAVYVQSA
jgi:hypothetical protein